VDSVKAIHGTVFMADAGGYFPEDDMHKDAAWFMQQSMMILGEDAVGVGDRDLRWGIAYLRENARVNKLPIVSANLTDKGSGKLIFAPSIVVTRNGVKAGFFSLISDKADLGPARDSLLATDPLEAARRTVADLRKRGANFVVLLSNLGKVEAEDLVSSLDGIDVVMVGKNSPLIQAGRTIKKTLAVYPGEQGQNIARVLITLDGGRKVSAAEGEVISLGAEVADKPDMLTLVKQFEDDLNERMRKLEKEQAAQRALASAENSPDHFVGMAVCERCHKAETEQWKTTAHARAWKTLVDAKKDADPECVKCHVVGFKQPGGFQTAVLTPTMSNVQCENCHGMGTQHEAFARTPRRITEATCRQCHTTVTSPDFKFDVFQPHIVHRVPATLPVLPQNPGMKKFLESAAPAPVKK
jgi:hypothetical protein